jgi:hypothetical protein
MLGASMTISALMRSLIPRPTSSRRTVRALACIEGQDRADLQGLRQPPIAVEPLERVRNDRISCHYSSPGRWGCPLTPARAQLIDSVAS